MRQQIHLVTVGLLLGAVLLTGSLGAVAGAPGPTVVGGKKALILVNREPPGVRCNNNMQVAAELQNTYKVPIVIIPQSLAGPGAKAPAVYFGDALLAVDGGDFNGMVNYTSLADVLEIEGLAKQGKGGRLLEVKKEFDTLKSAIKAGGN